MANTNKRVAKGQEAFRSVFTEAFMSIPEIANSADPQAMITDLFKKSGKELFRTAVRAKESPYEGYIDTKSNAKDLAGMVTAEISEHTDLSEASVKKVGAALAGVAKFVKDKKLEIPTTEVVKTDRYSVEAGGYADAVDDIYRANLTGTFKDTFGSGIDITGGAEASYTPQGVSIDRARLGAEAPFLGGTLSGEVSGDQSNQQARVNFTLPLKKGGKVKKKRKNKSYAKGSVVRTAKY